MKAALKAALRKLGVLDSAMFARNVALVIYGAIYFGLFRKTPQASYQSMISLFCQTQGKSNDLLSHLLSTLYRPYDFEKPTGILGDLNSRKTEDIVRDLDGEGYHVFETKLDPQLCKALYDLSLKTPVKTTTSIDPAIENGSVLDRYAVGDSRAVRFDFFAKDLLAHGVVQKIISDPSLLSVAQAYLRTKPVLDIISMWWTTAAKGDEAEAAQLFHFDMDRIKWLKFFFYLTDVTPEQGPHCFISGSHRSFGIPTELLVAGYARHSDDEVMDHYEPDRVVEFVGPVGTIIAEDTRGLHKGKVLSHGHRLVFQLEFTNSLFGTVYSKIPVSQEKIVPELQRATKLYPRVYSMIDY